MVGLSVAFAVIIGKEAFGGTGMNILNPALTARAFAFFAYPTYMSGNQVWVSEASNIDGVSGETILGILASGESILPYEPLQMFMGSIPGSIAETINTNGFNWCIYFNIHWSGKLEDNG